MKTVLALWLLALAVVLAPLAATHAQIVGGPQPTVLQPAPPPSAFATGVTASGGTVTVGALTGCITGGTPAVSGTQEALKVTGGTTAQTTCTITWPFPRQNAPVCSITGETTALLTVTAESTTALTWTFASTASTVWDIICKGN